MNVFDRLALGTANFGPKPYGHRGVTCSRKEQENIAAYALSCGIDTIHTKNEYGADLSWLPTYFDIIDGTGGNGQAPYELHEYTIRTDGTKWDWVNIPYSPFNKTWEPWLMSGHAASHEIHVRSIFCQGKVFTSNESVFARFRQYAAGLGIPVGTLCILFCLLNPNVDKVILGVDSEEQLRDNLRFFHRLDSFGVDDPKVIDPRLFEKEK
jgi:aryl-alcohol dehydrogenase-like predicted oxidoreductase